MSSPRGAALSPTLAGRAGQGVHPGEPTSPTPLSTVAGAGQPQNKGLTPAWRGGVSSTGGRVSEHTPAWRGGGHSHRAPKYTQGTSEPATGEPLPKPCVITLSRAGQRGVRAAASDAARRKREKGEFYIHLSWSQELRNTLTKVLPFLESLSPLFLCLSLSILLSLSLPVSLSFPLPPFSSPKAPTKLLTGDLRTPLLPASQFRSLLPSKAVIQSLRCSGPK